MYLLITYGALAQLGERLHGMQEVSGSIPLCSITLKRLQAKACRRFTFFKLELPYILLS